MQAIMDIYMAPRKIFTKLKEKAQWVTPLVIVLVVIALVAAFALNITRETLAVQQRETLEQRELSEEQIEQAMKLSQGPLALVGAAIGAAIFTTIILLLFALIINLFIPLFGGKSLYKTVFSVVCFSALIKVPAAILKLILIAITKSPFVTTSLALLAPNLVKNSFGYQLLAGFDFFIIWEMILVAIGISITNELKQKNAYILVFIIWIASVFIGVGLAGLSSPGM
jgi:hypothetical protein